MGIGGVWSDSADNGGEDDFGSEKPIVKSQK
jgi:hypothetical protein